MAEDDMEIALQDRAEAWQRCDMHQTHPLQDSCVVSLKTRIMFMCLQLTHVESERHGVAKI